MFGASNTSLPIIEARLPDVPSLTTIVARAFHPTNPYMKRTFPNTPAVRDWWTRIFTHQIENPNCRVLACISEDQAADQDEGRPPTLSTTPQVIGVLCLQLYLPTTSSSASFWTAYELTPDHDVEAYGSMVSAMYESMGEMMSGKKYFSVGLFGVEASFQGAGVGGRMMKVACKFADDEGCEMFVQANHLARRFYERCGFVCRKTKAMPGDEAYVECMLVRSPCDGRGAQEEAQG